MDKATTTNPELDTADPPILLAILIAARRTGDRLLESVAMRELRDRHGIRVRFGDRLHSGAIKRPGDNRE